MGCQQRILARSLRCVPGFPFLLQYGLVQLTRLSSAQPEPKQVDKLVKALSSFLVPSSRGKKGTKPKGGQDDSAALGEYASVMEGEYYEFVLFEIERVEGRGE